MADTLASLSAGNRSLILKLSTPTDWNNTKARNDLSGIKIWCSTTAGFTPADATLVFNGPASASISIPNLLDNTTYYVRYAFISSIDPTVFTYSKQYTQTTLTSTTGATGAATYRIYIAAANNAATPTTPGTTQNGATPAGWSATPVTLTGTQAQFQSDGSTPVGGTTTTWSAPYLSYFKVDTLEAITTNTGSLTVTGTFKAGTAAISGTTMTGAGGVLYNGGNFAFGDSTTNITYNGSVLKLNGNIVGQTNIVDGAISTAKFATGLEPVSIVTSIPTTKLTSSIFNSTDGKLYRWNGTAYIASVPAVDVTGQLSDSQIADIAAAKLTGQITSTQITDSAISTAKLAAGAITAAKIAADTITANEIAANAITASEIAAGAITAGKIAANAITANEIAANTITAGQIAAGTITATQISAGSITADRIDSRGLSIKDSAGNVILAAGSSLATSSFAGNVTGSVNGTNASTVISNISTAQSTANTANSTANTANSTANTANSTANTANSTANTALTNAATAQSTANSKLAKSGADILTGPISLSAATAILVGDTTNGLYLGNTGIVGRKAGVTTFSVDASGNAIFAGELSAATGSFGGNVTGNIGGTSASTVLSNITTAQTTANTANTTANTASSTASTASTTATAAQTTANTANTTANTANTTANTALTTANTANTNATAAQTAAAAKLSKTGSDTLVGPISLSASNAILVGTVNDGLYLGSTGIVGRKGSQTTFAVDASGNAIFKGDLTGASGTFTGNLTVGSSPAVSGTSMSGSGGVINSGGTFALGNSTTNVTYNGSALYLNGNIVATDNINANAVSGSDVYNDSTTKVSGAAVGTGYNYFTIATLYFQSFGNKVIVDSQAVCSIWGLTGTSGSQTFEVALFVDGSIVNCTSGRKDILGDATVLPDGSNLSYFQDIPLPMFVFTPNSNVHTYQLKIVYSKTGGAGNYYVAAKNVSLKAVEYKR